MGISNKEPDLFKRKMIDSDWLIHTVIILIHSHHSPSNVIIQTKGHVHPAP